MAKTGNFGRVRKFDDCDDCALYGDQMDFATKEAFNLLRTNIEYSFPVEEKNPIGHVIGITSSIQGEGKSSVAINLAYSLAEYGKSVLLIECDLRRPVAAKYLNINAKEGLSDFLIGHESSIIKHGVLSENLDIIFAGTVPLDPTVLLDSDIMANLLVKMSEKFNYILIDLPPVLPVPDAVLMAKLLDGMLFVVRGHKARKSDVNEAIRRLKYTSVRLLGIVYNDFDSSGKGYYKKYAKSYGNDESDD